MKSGFMLIELIISTLIASMVGSVLLTALYQGNRFQHAVDTMVDNSLRIGIINNQLEKDLMGAFVPVQARIKEKKEKPAAPAPDKKTEDKKDKTDAESTEKKVEKKEEKPLEKIFYSTIKAGSFDTLTFVTNDPLAVFVAKDVGMVKPKVVRVQYSLAPEVDRKDSFALMRQESTELDLGNYKSVRPYEVIGGIKECQITFTARIEKQEELPKNEPKSGDDKAPAKKEKAKAKEKEYEYKTFKEWTSEPKAENDKKKQQEVPRIPYSVDIVMVLWDKLYQKTESYNLFFEIPIDTMGEKKEEKAPEEPQKPEAKKGGKNAESAWPRDEDVAFAPVINRSEQSQTLVYNKQQNNDKVNDQLNPLIAGERLVQIFSKH